VNHSFIYARRAAPDAPHPGDAQVRI